MKRSDYPQSTHLAARIQAIVEANSFAAVVLQNLRDIALPEFPKSGLRDKVAEQITDALSRLELAGKAITGEDR